MTTIWKWDWGRICWILVRGNSEQVDAFPTRQPESPQIEWCVITDGREIYL